MAHSTSDINREAYRLSEDAWSTGRSVLLFVGLIGWVATIVGFFMNRPQFHYSYLIASVYFVTIALGAMFWVFLQHLGGAAWSVSIRRLGENVMSTIPIGIVLFLPNLLGLHYLYEWTHADVVAADLVLQEKTVFLNEPFFIARTVLYFVVWSFFAWKMYRLSVEQDQDPASVHRLLTSKKWSAFGILILVILTTWAAFDWLMSLNPHWYSTMFGLYILAGGAIAFICVFVLIALGLQKSGYLTDSITTEHYHDLGKLMFAFTVFWAYVAFSQYMLIWYGNLPEETVWFLRRLRDGWAFSGPLLVFGHFVGPFLLLMSRWAKRNRTVLAGAAMWLLFMQWFDLYWVVIPTFFPEGFHFHWLDVTTFLAVGATFGFMFWSRLRHAALTPVGDFRLQAAREFRNV
jgi:hypothetical protein